MENNREIKILLSADGKQFEAVIKNGDELIKQIKSSSKSIGDNITQWGIAMTGVNQALQLAEKTWSFLSEPIKHAAEMEVLRSAFKGTADDIELLRKATANTVSEANLIKLSNQANDLGISMEKQALLFALAEDAGDKYGGSLEENFRKIVFATEGNTKGLKDLGIQKEEYQQIVEALAKTHGDEINNLDAETQKQIRLEAILQATGITIDDVKNKTLDSKDQFEAAAVRTEEFAIALGMKLLPGVISVLEGFGNLTDIVGDLIGLSETNTEATIKQATEFNALIGIVMDVNAGEYSRNEAIKKLNEKYPELLTNINLETASYDELAKAQARANEEFLKKIKLAAAQDMIKEYDEKLMKSQKQSFIANYQMQQATDKSTREFWQSMVQYEKNAMEESKKDRDKFMQSLDEDTKKLLAGANNTIMFGPENKPENNKPTTKGTGKSFQSPVEFIDDKAFEDNLRKILELIDVYIQSNQEVVDSNTKNYFEEQKALEELSLAKEKYSADGINKIYEEAFANNIRLMNTQALNSALINEEQNLLNAEQQIYNARDILQLRSAEAEKDRISRRINLLKQESLARQEAVKNDILQSANQYNTAFSLGKNLEAITKQRIKGIIAEAIATQIGKVIASIPFPFNLFAVPLAAASLQALLDKLIPSFATGVTNFSGGLALVGERGPELVDIPRGSNVYPNSVTERIFNNETSSGFSLIAKEIRTLGDRMETIERNIIVDPYIFNKGMASYSQTIKEIGA